MAPKNKRAKGKTMKITDFATDYVAEDVYDYVDDSWMTEEQAKNEKLKEKLGMWEYRRTENNALLDQESFRNTSSELATASEDLIASLEPPFVAHVGNLRNGMTEDVFLSIFDESTIKTHRLINKEGKTFAFVEFTTADALAGALCLDKTLVRGRQMHVNLANAKQVERLFDGDNGKNITSPSERSFGNFSRDLFGSTSNLPGSGPTSPVSRDMFGSSGNAAAPIEITRDIIGSAVDTNSPDMPSSPLTFDNWRSEVPLDETATSDVNDNANNAKSPTTGSDNRNFRKGGAENQKAEVSAVLELPSWRSDVVSNSMRDHSPKGGNAAAKGFNADSANWRQERSSNTSDMSRKKVDDRTSFSPTNNSAEGKGKNSPLADDRWASLRR